jgi:sialate O-acetylesterase
MIEISESAQQYFKRLIDQQDEEGLGLRIVVNLPGTPGASCDLQFSPEGQRMPDDHVVEYDDFNMFVAKASEQWLAEAEASLNEGSPFPHPQPLMPEPTERDLCGFYNGKIHPIVPYAIKGVLWYQGESDMRNTLWDIELKAMAQSWRDLFDVKGKGEDIPFYWIQIQRSGDYCSPLVRQEQFNGLKLVPNSGMAVLLDLDVDVHPRNKVDTGIRLAHLALNRDYGKKDVVASGPLYKNHRVEGDTVIVEFDFADGGLRIGEKDMLNPPTFVDTKGLPNVELAGPDKRWHKAQAKIDGDKLVVRSADVPQPAHVRYCYTNIPDPPFLYNAAGLPAAMFMSLPE